MKRAGSRRFAPTLEQKLNHCDGANKTEPKPVYDVAIRVQFGLDGILAKDRRISFPSSGSSQSLPEGSDAERRADLCDADDIANVYSKLERRCANGRGRYCTILQPVLDKLTVLAGKIRVMRIELLGQTGVFA